MRKNYDINATSDDVFFNHSKSFKLVSKAIKKISSAKWEGVFSDPTQNAARGYDEGRFDNILRAMYSEDLARALDFAIHRNEIARIDIAIMMMKPETKIDYHFRHDIPYRQWGFLSFRSDLTITSADQLDNNPFFFTTLLRELKRAGIYDYNVNAISELYQLVHLASIALSHTGLSGLGESDSYQNAIGVAMRVIRRWGAGESSEVMSDLDRATQIWSPSESDYVKFYEELVIG